jgi:membrane-associated protein
VAATHGKINIVVLVTVIFIAAFLGDQIGFISGD